MHIVDFGELRTGSSTHWYTVLIISQKNKQQSSKVMHRRLKAGRLKYKQPSKLHIGKHIVAPEESQQCIALWVEQRPRKKRCKKEITIDS